MTKTILSILFLLVTLVSQAQDTIATEPQMADKFRADGKIYVVISVVAIIFISIVVFLFMLERKLKKLEDKSKS